ncbi:sterile alpha motif domain-containing protein 9-like isoform X1 [Haliotis rufescens]|uniref:sterile alpha motif domain-containing protein 9-like isoform X1 n=1 Tax=Haliotis rufescens TaxID=6454 RepID=UPI00201F5B62|nr:sterile alpha motif domain-containing protein 9-like isoform X1 [Haliotis rufescens]
MITPSIEFKYFCSSLDTVNQNSPIEKFLKETLRFACGCLNRRRNGTIYFGIADDKPVDGIKRRHGQVVGFPIMEVDMDSKTKYADALNEAKSKCFDSPEANIAAKECIKTPVFVKVAPSSEQVPLFVMEVDIEPYSSFCEGIKFKLDLTKICKKKLNPFLFVRDDAETRRIDSKEEELHFVRTLSKWDQKRKIEERSVSRQFSTENDHKYLAEKLCNKLCRHSNHFNLSLWPILVSSKPSDELKENLLKALSFISNIHWSAVFEFDDESSCNGLCKHFFSTPQTTLTSGEIFRDVENNNDLRDQLKLPENNVFIYCNGRSEIRKPHLRKRDWKKQYSPNVKAAINFFQQRSVIPLGRTIILFLLQGNDFDGFLHIFGEMITFFDSQTILLCEDRNIFKSFKEQALLQDIVDLEDLERNCIVGMTWEQTNDTINALLGVEKQSVTSIPTSTGGAVDVELKVQESWNTLQILSYNQCEDRQFETPLDKQQFGKEKELKFYQGNRVEWWNFFFEGHVMTRHCFRNLRNKVHDALTGQKSDKTKVVPIILNHEPGAGGSTLVRHILWEFHKDFRCAVVTKLLEKTAGDILSFWRYKEKDIRYAQPVLLVIDSVIEYKLDLDELHRLVTIESWKMESNTKKPVCVFLICKREESINSFPRTHHQDISALVYLPQKVGKAEKEWLTNKIQQLEDTSRDLGLTHFKGEYFISFMILHSNFEQEFLQETIHNLLKDMNVEDRLFKLLMYVALVIRYVSPPKGGAAIAIPVECCSEHMGLHSRIDTGLQKNSLWENNLDGPLKILLLIEMKEYGSGKQIRMAHPNLARAVIGCIQTKYLYCELSSIAMDFLRSDLLKTTSYGKKFLNQLTVEMLTRRKKEEYNDDENTYFSPLIASILSESGQCKPAANVLGKGFELLKDSSIAHQLARLHVHYKEYDLAKEWAKQAVELSPRRSIFLHTYENVFKQNFLNLKIWDSKNPVNPADEATTGALDLALEALRHFQNACTCEKFEKNLLAHHDTLSTVLCIARFINEIVGIRRDELSNYFTEDVVPEAVVCWENYHSKLKMLFSIGFEAVEELDEHIYYKQCSYASKYNQQNDAHRISRCIKGKLPDMFEDFINFFCPRTDLNDPPPYVKSDELRDGWHRRCIVSLGGKRLVDIFRITLSDTKDAATQLLYTVRRHLKEIKEASADDYLTLVAVNLALAQMRAAKQNSMTDLYGYCKQIILAERKRNVIHMAYMYIVMLQWPRKTQEIQYDHDLMKKAMRYLFDESRAKKHQKLKAENEFFKRENNIYHSVTLFFLGKERGLSRFIYHSHLFGKRKQKDLREEVWERHDIKERLQLVYGYTKIRHNSCAISIVADMEQYGLDNEIEVRNLKCRPLELSERPVSFYLGFSLSGPVVCYVCPTETNLGGLRFAVDNIEYSQLTKAELLNLQREIEQLKTKARLNEKEEVLIRDEREIAEALWRFESDKTIFD